MLAPALFLAIPLAGGAAAATLAVDRLPEGFAFLAAAGSLLALLAAIGSTLQDDLTDACLAAVLGGLLVGLSLGATAAQEAYRRPLLQWFLRESPTDPILVEGTLREDAVPTALGVSLALGVLFVDGHGDGAELGGVRLSVGGTPLPRDLKEWRAGRTIRAPAYLRLPSTYLNPGTMDERRPLARRGIVLVGSIKSGTLVEVVQSGTVLSEWAAAIRAWTRARVAAHLATLDPKSAGVTTAVLIGDRSGLADEDERPLQLAGTYHVIAISGGNIAILAVLAVLICRALLVPSCLAAVATACGLLFYGVVAAGAASVTRAVTVAVLVLAARAVDHRGGAINALAVAATIAVAVSPLVILDAGFVLSFGATLGIVLGVPLLVRSQSRRHSVRTHTIPQAVVLAAKLGAATICAEVALAPVTATIFSRVTFAGLLLNFLAIPLMTIVQIAGLTLALTSGWSRDAADLAGWIAHLAATGLLRSANLVDVAPWLSVNVRPPAWWLSLGYYGCALALLLPRVRRAAAVSIAFVAGVMLAGPHATSRDGIPPASVALRMVSLDVGQGDSTVLQLPGSSSLLVDTGGLASFGSEARDSAFDIGERIVTPAVRALGITRLNAIIITHGDPDHLLGARGVLRAVPAASVWEGIPVPPHPGLQALDAFARARGMSWRTVQAGDVERFGEVEVRVLHPMLPDWERQRVRNEDSVVLEVRLGNVSLILPGDIGKEGEPAVIPRLEPGRLVVLKAPHHGSATSSTKAFLDALRPAAVIFSCGRDNRFGHPHPTVVARYKESGSEIFSTAEDGAVFVETDGAKVELRGWTGRRVTLSAPR